MSKVGDRAPGWYPDPDDPARMRRWDGAHWTPDHRPLPSWYSSSHPQGSVLRRNRHWVILATVMAFVVLALGFRSIQPKVKLPPRTVTDAAFIASANRSCQARLVPLHNERPRLGTAAAKNPGDETTVAGQVDHIVSELLALQGELKGLPLDAAQQATVSQWMADWDTYIDYGRQYAGFLRAHDIRSYSSVAQASTTSGQRANLFAQANGLDDCKL